MGTREHMLKICRLPPKPGKPARGRVPIAQVIADYLASQAVKPVKLSLKQRSVLNESRKRLLAYHAAARAKGLQALLRSKP